jgi:hypothetical protein
MLEAVQDRGGIGIGEELVQRSNSTLGVIATERCS